MADSNLDYTAWPTRDPCFNDGSCNVTSSMLQFLNVTTKADYIRVYCTNPPNDSCPFGFCPNPDIAGPSIRVSTYITNLCLTILILYNPGQIEAAFYSQLLSIYSFMLTAMIAIRTRSLTRLHATFAQYTVASPLSLFIVIYAMRSIIARKKNRHHSLSPIVGKGQVLNRILVLAMVPVWIVLTIFISLPSQRNRFSQTACDWRLREEGTGFWYYNPFTSLIKHFWVGLAAASPVILLVLFWVTAIFLKRKIIWKPGRSKKYPFERIWSKVNKHYPLLRFYTIVILPFSIWCISLELGTRPADQEVQFTFGQIVPMFLAIPPLIGVIKLIPRIWHWFVDLSWIRWFTGREKRKEQDDEGTGLIVLKHKEDCNSDCKCFDDPHHVQHALNLNSNGSGMNSAGTRSTSFFSSNGSSPLPSPNPTAIRPSAHGRMFSSETLINQPGIAHTLAPHAQGHDRASSGNPDQFGGMPAPATSGYVYPPGIGPGPGPGYSPVANRTD